MATVYLDGSKKPVAGGVNLHILPPIGATVEFNIELSLLEQYLDPFKRDHRKLGKNIFIVDDVKITYGNGDTAFNFRNKTEVEVWLKTVKKKEK